MGVKKLTPKMVEALDAMSQPGGMAYLRRSPKGEDYWIIPTLNGKFTVALKGLIERKLVTEMTVAGSKVARINAAGNEVLNNDPDRWS